MAKASPRKTVEQHIAELKALQGELERAEVRALFDKALAATLMAAAANISPRPRPAASNNTVAR